MRTLPRYLRYAIPAIEQTSLEEFIHMYQPLSVRRPPTTLLLALSSLLAANLYTAPLYSKHCFTTDPPCPPPPPPHHPSKSSNATKLARSPRHTFAPPQPQAVPTAMSKCLTILSREWILWYVCFLLSCFFVRSLVLLRVCVCLCVEQHVFRH